MEQYVEQFKEILYKIIDFIDEIIAKYVGELKGKIDID